MEMKCSLHQLIRFMLSSTGTSAKEASRRIGKSEGYVSVMLFNETMPGADLLAELVNACDYRVKICGPMDMESWELTVEDGKLVANLEFSPADVADRYREEEESREALKEEGAQEVIDSLIEFLESLKRSRSSDGA